LPRHGDRPSWFLRSAGSAQPGTHGALAHPSLPNKYSPDLAKQNLKALNSYHSGLAGVSSDVNERLCSCRGCGIESPPKHDLRLYPFSRQDPLLCGLFLKSD